MSPTAIATATKELDAERAKAFEIAKDLLSADFSEKAVDRIFTLAKGIMNVQHREDANRLYAEHEADLNRLYPMPKRQDAARQPLSRPA